MFGIDPRHMNYMKENSKLLQTVSEIAVPKILSWAEMDGREYLVVEQMKGHALSSFKNQSHELLYRFGVWLAKVHSNTLVSMEILRRPRSENGRNSTTS
jgi:aminoglycoside phosphotransferase